MKKRKPTHPGVMLLEEFLKPTETNQSDFADHIVVDYKTINRLVNEKCDLTPVLAEKIAAATNTSVQFWLNLQQATTVWKLQKEQREVPDPFPGFLNNTSALMIKTNG